MTVFTAPVTPYTRTLLAAAFDLDLDRTAAPGRQA